MIESVVPWTTTAVFMVGALGVPFADYWYWQLLSPINFIVAPTVAILGIGCFYHEVDKAPVDTWYAIRSTIPMAETDIPHCSP